MFALYMLVDLWNILVYSLEGSDVFCYSLSGLLLLAYNSSDGPWTLAEYFGVDRLFLDVITYVYSCADGWSVNHDGHSVSACLVLNLALTCS